jgi:hypothetical protein
VGEVVLQFQPKRKEERKKERKKETCLPLLRE